MEEVEIQVICPCCNKPVNISINYCVTCNDRFKPVDDKESLKEELEKLWEN